MAATRRGKGATASQVLLVTPGQSEEETEEKTEQEVAAEHVIEETTANNQRSPEAIIYRLDADSGEEKWVAKVSSSLVSHEWIAKKYGGGNYRVQHRKPNATGKMVYAQQETYKIDPSVKPEAPLTAPVMNADGSSTGGGGSRIDAIMEAGVMSLIQQMQNANTTQMELVRSIVAERGAPKGPNFTEILTALSPIIAAVIPAITNRPDVMTQAREIAELAAKNQGAQGGLKDFIGAFKEMMEVKDMLGGGGGDERGTGERLLEAAIPKFMEIADRYAQNAPAAPVAMAPGPVIQPRMPQAMAPAGALPQPQEEPVLWTAFVNRRVPHWVKLASLDKDPSLYAELEIDNMPPMFMGQLREFLSSEGAIDLVLGAFPQLAKYEHWSRDFFAEITNLVLGEEEDGDGGEDGEDIEEDDIEQAGGGSGDGGTERVAVEDGGGSDERGPVEPTGNARRTRNQSRQGSRRSNGGNEAPTS